MGDLRKKVVIVIISALVIGVAYFTVGRRAKGTAHTQIALAQRGGGLPQEGNVAPDFTLPNLSGNEVELSDFRGKVIFLNFWATWCPPCRGEMPSMEALYQRLKGGDFQMLAVSVDRRGNSVVGPFAQEFKLTFPILLDLTGRVGSIYGVRGIPTTFILDKKGIIVEKVVGAKDWANQDFIERLQALINRD